MTQRHEIIRLSALSVLMAIEALAAAVAARVVRATRILRHRRDLEFLAGLDDRMLRDIGLTRSDLRFALAEPFWRDPGAALISRVGQRGAGNTRPTAVPSIVPGRATWGGRATVLPRRSSRWAA